MALRRFAAQRGSDRDFVYLLMLVRKYGLEPSALHHALMRVKGNKKSMCGALSIALRERRGNIVFFMFSQNNRAVAQAAISEHSLEKLGKVPGEFARLLKDLDRQFTDTDCAELEECIGGQTDMRKRKSRFLHFQSRSAQNTQERLSPTPDYVKRESRFIQTKPGHHLQIRQPYSDATHGAMSRQDR